ncbi:hypothetical protein ACIQGO_23005 [Streptomyces shenzhenensis]
MPSARCLRRPQFNGLVASRAYGGSPPRVEYELTGPGRRERYAREP